MIKRTSIIYVVSLLIILGCNHSRTSEDTQSVFGVVMKGASRDAIIKKLIEQTDEFDYYDNEREGIKRVFFCGVPCGLNIQSEQKDEKTIISSIVLFTSLQDKVTFDILKDSISMKYGNPDLEEYEGGTEEIDGRYCGKCRWGNGEILLRNAHSDEGGLVITFSPTVCEGNLTGKDWEISGTDSV